MAKKEKTITDVVQETDLVVEASAQETKEPASKKTTKKTKSDTTKKSTTKAPKTDSKKSASSKVSKKVVVPEVYIQLSGSELDVNAITTQVKMNWVNEGHDEKVIESVKVYIKPEEAAVYYVINETETGKVDL